MTYDDYSMLNISLYVLKCILIFTFLRLISTAFGFEFGISRQYLRVLELIFKSGQKRIEKVESKARFSFPIQYWAEDEDENYEKFPELEEEQGNGDISNRPESLDIRPLHDGSSEHINCIKTPSRCSSSSKIRRVSTPDGPPIFLLDDDDYSDEFSDDDQNNQGDELNQYDIDIKSNRLTDENTVTIKRTEERRHNKHEFHLDDVTKLVVKGITAIIDDQVTKRFSKEELKTWNLLTRSNAKNYQFMSGKLGLYWFAGFLFRYIFLLPLRIIFTLTGFAWLVLSMSIVNILPTKFNIKDRCYCLLSLMSFRMLSCGITSRLEFHNRQYRAQKGDICVANHTSPLDVLLLACDNCYALIGQRHGGVLGFLERALSRATNHVWFDRSEMRDRQLVTQRLKNHVERKNNLPVLIFPEGTCINNSAVMMFRKGTFETTDRVCPVAIKYDPRFGDPFWNSSKESYAYYLFLLMSSWAIKCEVWYLPPMEREYNETGAEFANRVKAEIARQGGLVDLAWDGQLKRQAAKEIWRHQQQEDFAKRLKLD